MAPCRGLAFEAGPRTRWSRSTPPWPRGVDYVGFGPIFGTTTKETALSPRGLGRLARAVEHSPVPVVAIGGLTLETLGELMATGVSAWAPISAIHGAPDPLSAARSFSR